MSERCFSKIDSNSTTNQSFLYPFELRCHMPDNNALKNHRLHVMQGVLAWEGEIGNSRVRELFDVQLIQASRLLSDLKKKFGNQVVVVGGRARAIRPADPRTFPATMTLAEYSRVTGLANQDQEVIEEARLDFTNVPPSLFATLRQAVITRSGVEIHYASMSSPKPAARIIFPHVLVQVGRRWHVRAWCETRKAFRDFTLGRIYSANLLADTTSPKGRSDDTAWNTRVTIKLIAHSQLGPEQQRVISDEYFGGCTEKSVSSRACLCQYVIQELRAAVSPDKERPPDYQIEVANIEELRGYLFSSGV